MRIEEFIVEGRPVKVAAKRVPNKRSEYEVSVFEQVDGHLVGLAERVPVWKDTNYVTKVEWRAQMPHQDRQEAGYGSLYSALFSVARNVVRNVNPKD